MSNPFSNLWKAQEGNPYIFNDFLEFLEEFKLKLYGIEITPENIRRIRHELLSRNIEVK